MGEEDWHTIYREAHSQTVQGFLYAYCNLHLTQFPEDIKKRCQNQFMQQIARYYQMLEQQKELLELLVEHKIQSVIIKGCAAGFYYPDPSLRTYGDIDFLVHPNDFDDAYQLLKSNGYELEQDEIFSDHHIALKKDRLTFELHRKPNKVPKEYLPLIYEGLKHIETVKLEEYRIPVLPPLQNGLVLFFHIISHLNYGLGLRQIIDWQMYVENVLNDEFWNTTFQSLISISGYEKFCKIVTKLCQNYLGLNRDITWCKDADDSLCQELFEYIMEQGNFGCKNMSMDRGAKVLSSRKNSVEFFKLLQENGKHNWKTKSGIHVVERYPLLCPFAWIYQSYKYIRITAQKGGMKYLWKSRRESKERRKFFERLGLN